VDVLHRIPSPCSQNQKSRVAGGSSDERWKSCLRSFIVGTWLVTLTCAAGAQTLWQATSFGMSPDQVRAIVPNAIEASNPSPLGSGAVGLLKVPSIEIVNRNFAATFFFKNGGLTDVQLSNTDGTFSETRNATQELLAALTAKYGTAVAQGKTSLGIEAQWVAGRTTVKLFTMEFRNIDKGSVYIHYSARLAEQGDKL
jgi:hypothetical protein